MNDIMFEPRCSACRDSGWIEQGDKEYPCACSLDSQDYEMKRDLGEEHDNDY